MSIEKPEPSPQQRWFEAFERFCAILGCGVVEPGGPAVLTVPNGKRLVLGSVGQVGNAVGEVYPGYPGLGVAGGELRSMTWGFLLSPKGAKGQPLKPKPVNNTRADKLDSFMWRYSFAERRCLIPVTQFAEAVGERGAKTRTWFSLPDQDVFACAGVWRDTPEWGPAYSMA